MLYTLNDPQIIGEIVRGASPQEAGSMISMIRSVGYVLVGVGLLLFGLGLAKSIFTPKPSK